MQFCALDHLIHVLPRPANRDIHQSWLINGLQSENLPVGRVVAGREHGPDVGRAGQTSFLRLVSRAGQHASIGGEDHDGLPQQRRVTLPCRVDIGFAHRVWGAP